MFQGSSKITYLKESHLEGLVLMRLRMLTYHMERVDKLVLADLFCGAGEYLLDGYLMDGSPLAIFNGLQEACRGKFRTHSDKVEVHLSDVRQEAVSSSFQLLVDKYSHKPDLFAHNSYVGLVKAYRGLAGPRLGELHKRLVDRPRDRLIGFIDPNGTTDLPYLEMMSLLTDKRVTNRCDLFVNISATSLKRINRSPAAQARVRDWVGRLDNLFVNVLGITGNQAWIRKPIPGDAQQWTIIAYWSRPNPYFDWPKAGFVPIGTRAADKALEHYSTTNDDKELVLHSTAKKRVAK